ncbi:MAG: type II secretion system protein GspG [Pseudomonadota bacterium]|nr:type II secretion system protein GspG [Pseudomonadota bacterium]
MSRKNLLWLSVLLLLISILLGIGFPPGHMDVMYNSNVKITDNRLIILINALETFKKDVGQYPSTTEGLQALISRPAGNKQWKGPYITAQELSRMKAVDRDIWGTKYIYFYPAKHSHDPHDLYDLYSCGKNKQDDLGEGDDISLWKAKNPAFYGKEDNGLYMHPLSQIRGFLLLLIIILLISAIFVKK